MAADEGRVVYVSESTSTKHDLMGVEGDVLFADPLGVRRGSEDRGHAGARGTSPAPAVPRATGTAPVVSPRIAAPPPDSSAKEAPEGSDDAAEGVGREEDQPAESLVSVVGGWLWYIISGGRECCSMRDRTKDADAAKRASQTGRPPGFPAPCAGGHDIPRPVASARPRDGPEPEDSDSDLGSGTPPSSFCGSDVGSDADAKPSGAASTGAAAARQLAPEGGKLGGAAVERLERRASNASSYRALSGSLASSGSSRSSGGRSLPPVSSARSGGRQVAERLGGVPEPSAPSDLAGPAAQRGQQQGRKWPPWALRYRTPCIEVFVEDEETGEARWVEGEPQSSVIDPAGGDAFLEVEYCWDGEHYTQDFGPEHVRQKGGKVTVKELLRRDGLL